MKIKRLILKSGANFGCMRQAAKLVAAGAALMAVAACAVGGGVKRDWAQAAEPDRVATASIASAPQIAARIAPDSAAVVAELNALADGGKAAGGRAWQNKKTGSRGVLSAFAAAKADNGAGRLCRRFQTSRESYDGSALYRGEACKYGKSSWLLHSLREE